MGLGTLPEYEVVDRVTVRRIPCGRRRKEMASPWEALRWMQCCWPLVRQLHQERPYEVTHAHFIMPAGAVARRLKRHARVPFLVTPHGSDVPGYNRERLKLAHVLARPWWKAICREADQLASPSASLLTLLRAVSRDCRSMVIPNGFEPGRFRPLEKQRRILLCGRLVARKGFQYFLEALRDLDLPGWEIDLVGAGPMLARLRQLARQCRIPVHLWGWIDNESPRLAQLHGQAMIYAFPSEWENFSIALLEGMSAGCAVIATDVAGNPEVVGDTGCLVPPKDVAALRAAVTALTADPDRCAELGRRAAERAASQFDWQHLADRYLSQLQRLVTHPSAESRR